MKTIESIIKILTIIIIIAVIILAILLVPTVKRMYRYMDNTEQLMNDLPDKNIFLTKKGFKEYQKKANDSLFMKIKDSLNIKFKHIEKTITHRYNYSYDTTVTVLIQSENKQEKQFSKSFDNCIEISGRINWENDTIYFDKVEIDYTAETVYYWQRSRKILGIPFGRKKHYAITENNCTGQTETQSIEILKRK